VNPRRLFVPIVGKEWQYQADLMFFDRGSQKIPILVMIELTSRKAYGRIMTNKKTSTTAAALQSILSEIAEEGNHCHSIEHDDGSEFKREFAALLVAKHIQSIVFPRGNASKTALGKINIFVRTIRTLMEKADKNRGGDWRTTFPALMALYNSNVSHATGFAPNKVTDTRTFELIRAKDRARNPGAAERSAYDVGDRVRVLIDYDAFQKKSKPRFSDEIFHIATRQGFSYTLQDSDGHDVMTPKQRTLPVDGVVSDPETETNPHIRLFRAREMLRIDKVEEAPARKATQRDTKAQAKASNQVNKNRREIDTPAIVQDVPIPDAFATAPRATRVRAPKVEEPRAVRVPKPKRCTKSQRCEGIAGQVKILEFRVKYAHLGEEKNKKYEWQFARNFANNILVNAYRKEHGI
jgi:hypothetical protein